MCDRRRTAAQLTTMEVDLFFFHDMPPSSDLPDSLPIEPGNDRTRTRDRGTAEPPQSHPDAANALLRLSPTSPQRRNSFRRQIRRQDSTLSPRDRDVLLAL